MAQNPLPSVCVTSFTQIPELNIEPSFFVKALLRRVWLQHLQRKCRSSILTTRNDFTKTTQRKIVSGKRASGQVKDLTEQTRVGWTSQNSSGIQTKTDSHSEEVWWTQMARWTKRSWVQSPAEAKKVNHLPLVFSWLLWNLRDLPLNIQRIAANTSGNACWKKSKDEAWCVT